MDQLKKCQDELETFEKDEQIIVPRKEPYFALPTKDILMDDHADIFYRPYFDKVPNIDLLDDYTYQTTQNRVQMTDQEHLPETSAMDYL